jgi:uncharacterized protein
MQQPYLFIAPTDKKGRGVFTQEKIAANTLIEIAPAIILSEKERKAIEKTKLHDYVFAWGKKANKGAIALGYVSIYNHSQPSNCEYTMDFENELIYIKTVRAIQPNEELTINYNGNFDDPAGVWFKLEK